MKLRNAILPYVAIAVTNLFSQTLEDLGQASSSGEIPKWDGSQWQSAHDDVGIHTVVAGSGVEVVENMGVATITASIATFDGARTLVSESSGPVGSLHKVLFFDGTRVLYNDPNTYSAFTDRTWQQIASFVLSGEYLLGLGFSEGSPLYFEYEVSIEDTAEPGRSDLRVDGVRLFEATSTSSSWASRKTNIIHETWNVASEFTLWTRSGNSSNEKCFVRNISIYGLRQEFRSEKYAFLNGQSISDSDSLFDGQELPRAGDVSISDDTFGAPYVHIIKIKD